MSQVEFFFFFFLLVGNFTWWWHQRIQYKVYYGVFFKGKKTPEISAKVAIFWVKKMSEVTWYSNKNFFREGHSKNETRSQKLSTLLFEFSPNLAHSSSGWFANPPTWQIWRNKGYVMSVVTLLWPCQFTFKSILVQKNNHGNSTISPCQNIIFKKKKKNPLYKKSNSFKLLKLTIKSGKDGTQSPCLVT